MAAKKPTKPVKSAAKKPAAKETQAKKPTAVVKATATATAKILSGKKPVQPIRELKPGWLSRVFGIETGRLMACDAHWAGDNWDRKERFTFLYRSKRSKFFVLHDTHNWTHVEEDEARRLYAKLPEKVMDEVAAFAEPVYEELKLSRDEEDDDNTYKVVKNEKGDYSIWLDYKKVPGGWFEVGFEGKKLDCLDYIRKNCVFGVPGIPSFAQKKMAAEGPVSHT